MIILSFASLLRVALATLHDYVILLFIRNSYDFIGYYLFSRNNVYNLDVRPLLFKVTAIR